MRRGGIVPLIAFMLPVFFIFIAFAVDYGAISVGKHQLQNAADAAAVASVEAYFVGREHGDRAGHEVITANRLLGESIEFDIEESIEYGNWDSDAKVFVAIPRDGSMGSRDETSGRSIPIGATAVRVTLLRAPEKGNGLNLFFGPIFGTDHATIEARAIASASPS